MAYKFMEQPMNRGVDYNIKLPDLQGAGGVDITAVDFAGANFVTYDSFGRPSSGGTVAISCGGQQATITLEALSGNVTVSD